MNQLYPDWVRINTTCELLEKMTNNHQNPQIDNVQVSLLNFDGCGGVQGLVSFPNKKSFDFFYKNFSKEINCYQGWKSIMLTADFMEFEVLLLAEILECEYGKESGNFVLKRVLNQNFKILERLLTKRSEMKGLSHAA